jgi:hypothetical protein
VPVVLLLSASLPRLVLPPPCGVAVGVGVGDGDGDGVGVGKGVPVAVGVGLGLGLGVGVVFTACALGESAKKVRASAMRNKPCRKGDRRIEFFTDGVFIVYGAFLGFTDVLRNLRGEALEKFRDPLWMTVSFS